MVSRPSEAVTATVGSIVAAVLVLLNEAFGVELSANAAAAIVLLISWVAAAVTWWIGRRQRAGELVSNPDGTVEG